MPNVKDFKNKKQAAKKEEDMEATSLSAGATEARPKRRPGREEPEASTAEVKVVDVEEGVRETAGEELHASHVKSEEDAHRASAEPDREKLTEHASDTEASFEERPEGEKVEIHFFGSELIRAKFPKPFEVAEAVATDWVKGGDFDRLPIEHPLAQYAVKTGLQRAKEVEKKVLESPVTEKVAMQVLTAGMKAQSLIEQVRSRLKKD
jgi:hypothetical protein